MENVPGEFSQFLCRSTQVFHMPRVGVIKSCETLSLAAPRFGSCHHPPCPQTLNAFVVTTASFKRRRDSPSIILRRGCFFSWRIHGLILYLLAMLYFPLILCLIRSRGPTHPLTFVFWGFLLNGGEVAHICCNLPFRLRNICFPLRSPALLYEPAMILR